MDNWTNLIKTKLQFTHQTNCTSCWNKRFQIGSYL